ncbi:hypothetical protein BU23DRAFT_554120 [Bimuria novae-zelandiae CBS 107.79]|uniref:Uncharacterized protein n=1 Tax=Bimuria novae-zelandiae CBS 107.79 TaxID=1447943 RepID=A0A6A5V8P2_9PLEO|nr:hypothetical protein BU23DRAFT_554120 [Bimuria novae-zelandiae CBS 107.79]
MGYSEKLCRLCGVLFNIGQRRLRSEPAWMGWECSGDYNQVGCQLRKGNDPNRCLDDWYSEEEEDNKENDDGNGDESIIGLAGLDGEEGEYAVSEEPEGDDVLESQIDEKGAPNEEEDEEDRLCAITVETSMRS